MVIYQKLLPRTKKRGVFYLSLKISSLNRLASYDEYPPGNIILRRRNEKQEYKDYIYTPATDNWWGANSRQEKLISTISILIKRRGVVDDDREIQEVTRQVGRSVRTNQKTHGITKTQGAHVKTNTIDTTDT